jgi:glutathione synthase/RimK-type ligase-like ATP-grasp enzyme
MTPNRSAQPAGTLDARPSMMGLARLMTLAFEGADLIPIAQALIERASANEADAEALMDLSTVLQLQGLRDVGLATQAQALQIQRVYELPAARWPTLRLLAIMAPGDLMTNTPLPFLVSDSDIALTLLYLLPGEPMPRALPAHDVVFIAVSESDPTRALLDQLAEHVPMWRAPVVNRPERIARTSRAQACTLLDGAPGVAMPASARVTRDQLLALAAGTLPVGELLAHGVFPLIVRPVDSHAGHGLDKVEAAPDLSAYLRANAGAEFFISRFIDYRSRDGLFRKYRVVLVDGVPYAGHMGVSAHWMIHYLNAGMTDSADKRAQEAAFIHDFESDFARRHAVALRAIAERVGLDYLVIDCGETADGELLVFEVDPGAVVHAMDPVAMFPYKRPQMDKVFTAFRALLLRAIGAER